MPHRTYSKGSSIGFFDTLDEQLQIEAGYAKSVYPPITPLYLERKSVHWAESIGNQPQPADDDMTDPVRSYFGHWYRHTSIASDFIEGAAGANLVNDLPGWVGETDNRFVRPRPTWSHPSNGKFNVKTFRILAKKKVKTVSTEPKTEWVTLKTDLAQFGGPSDWVDHDLLQFGPIKEAALNAINSGYLPHYHEGYIDGSSRGFTTAVFVDAAWIEIAKFLQSPSGIGDEYPDHPWNPPHHTHLINTYKEGIVKPDLHDPTTFKLNGWLYDAKHHKVSSGPGTSTTVDPMGFHGQPVKQMPYKPAQVGELIEIEDIEEITFLESVDLYYSNQAVNKVIKDAGLSTLAQLDKNTMTNAEQVEYMTWEPKINSAFSNHIKETYKKKVHNYGPAYSSTPASPLPDSDTFLGGYSTYTDTVFSLNEPAGSDFGYTDSQVNFINLDYEDAVNILSDQQHLLIPNTYLLGQLAEDKERFYSGPGGDNTIYGDLLTAGDTAKSLPSPDNQYANAWNFNKNIAFNEYLNIWKKNINPQKNESIDVPGLNGNKIFCFPKYNFVQEYSPKSEKTFPWNAKISFNVPASKTDNQFLKTLFVGPDWTPASDTDVYPDYSLADLANFQDEGMIFLMSQVASTEGEQDHYYRRDLYSMLGNARISTWDITEYLNADWSAFNPKSENIISFEPIGNWYDPVTGTYPEPVQPVLDPTNTKWFLQHLFLVLQDKLKQFSNTRSVYEILNAPLDHPYIHGKWSEEYRESLGVHYDIKPFSHTEIMFYEIEKRKHGQIIQRIFIASPINAPAPIEYFDSQIKLNEGYDYTIYTYVMSVGNEYQYQDIQPLPLNVIHDVVDDLPLQHATWAKSFIDVEDTSSSAFKAKHPVGTIYTINRPIVKLLKIPYKEFATLYAYDYPPIYPNVEILPYQNVNNKLLFLLSQYVGEYKDTAIPILPGDEDLFNKAKLAQAGPETSTTTGFQPTVKFKSDEPDHKYQVFRLEKHPTDWSDFSTALRKEMFQEKDFIDTIVPNKKYYYMFRSGDRHGYISNPSPIFEVELIDDSGAIYLSTKTVDFVKKVPVEDTKSVRKYVHIVPTIKQSNLNAPDLKTLIGEGTTGSDSIHYSEMLSQYGHDVTLGSVFGSSKHEPTPRKFKVRFTSKSSGKMFDLNLDFIHIHEGKDDDLIL